MKKLLPEDVLNPKTGEIRKHEYIGFDIETVGKENDFVSAAFVDEDNNQWFFTDKIAAQEFILSRSHRNKYFVATNLTFDFCGLFWGTPIWNKFKMVFRGGDLMFCSYPIRERVRERDGKTVSSYEYIRFIDTMNYVPFGVAKLGNIIGLEKKTPPSWLGERTPRNNDEWSVYREYNVRDAMVSCQFMRFIEDSAEELGAELKISAASTSLDLFQRKYLERSLIKETAVIRRNEGVDELIRDAYYGGRTETFKRGYVKGLNYYDINSLYPSVMINEYPIPQTCYTIREPNLENIYLYEGVSRCLVTAPDDLNIPLLPYATDTKLLFPLGNFQGAYNHVELRKAIELGYKIIPIQQIIYTDVFRPFDNFVKDLYSKRLEYKEIGDPMELSVKLMLNSLYGKFAQNDKTEIRIHDTTFYNDNDYVSLEKYSQSGAMITVHDEGAIFLMKKDKPANQNFIFPILSSYCTSYARLKLYEYLERYDPYYCDTDSIMTKETIPTSKDLGAMKLEKHVDEAVLIRSKLYRIDEEIKAKGIRNAGREDFEDILNHASIEKIRFMKPLLGLRQGIRPNTIVEIEKTLDLEDDKRSWPDAFNPKTLQVSIPRVL